MANKILTIDFDIGTAKLDSGIATVINKVKAVADETTKQAGIEEKLSSILIERTSLLASYAKSMSNIAASKLDEINKEKSLISLAEQYNTKLREQAKLQNELKASVFARTLGLKEEQTRLTEPTKPQAGFSYTSGASNVAQQKAPKVDSTTLERTAQSLDFNLVSGATKAATIIKKAEQSFADRIASTPLFKPASDYAINMIRGMSQAAREIEKVNTASEGVRQKHKSLVVHLAEIIGLYKVINSLINVASNTIKAIPRIGIELEATVASLTSTIGSGAGASSALEAITKEAERTGLSLASLRTSFRTFQASTSLAGESLDSTWRMFTNINTVAAALHLTIAQTNGVFLALAQIFNKTKVQSEELVKQLGNLLPGAFASFAAANRDLFKNSAELIAKMKLGVVTAHDTVEKFTSYLASRFGSAFNLASQGLNANIGRMQTSFTLLGEAIYSTTRGPMIEVIKGITSIANYLTDAVKGANNFGAALEQLALVGIASVIGSVGAMALKFYEANKAILATAGAATVLRNSFAFLSTPAAIITGISLIALEIKKLATEASDAQQRIDEFFANLKKQQKDLSEAEKLTIKIDADPAVKTTLDVIEDIKKKISDGEETLVRPTYGEADLFAKEKTKQALEKYYNDLTFAEEELIRQRENVKLKMELGQQGKSADALDAYHTKRTELTVALEEERGNLVNAARIRVQERFRQLYEDAKRIVASPKPTDNLEEAKKTIAEYEELLSKAGQKKLQKQDFSEAKGNYKEYNDLIKSVQEQQAAALSEEEAKFQQNIISFEEYYKKKKEILQNSYESEAALQRDLGKRAASVGDTTQKVDSDEKLIQLKAKHSVDLAKLETERYANSYSFQKELLTLEQDYYTSVGENERALKIQLQEKYGLLENALKTQIEGGNLAKQIDLDRINIIKEMALAEASVARDRLKVSSGMAKYEQDINRVNILKNVGALSELEAAIQIKELNEDKIKLKEEELAIEEKILAKTPGNTGEYDRQKEKIRSLREELQQFKLTANTVGDYFKQTLSPAMANAFVGFVSGTMTAKDAFKSFATSILQEIAKIAAQRLALEIIGGLLKAFESSGADQFGASSSGRIISAVPQANGGVNTGMGAGNGMILSSPTYFPNARPTMFASGGVVAGEAGHEAVLPLKRTKSGKLGVMVEGNSGGGITIQTMNISVQSKDDASSEEQADLIGKAVKNSLRTMVQQEIASSKRSGGQLNPTQLATSL